MALGVLHSPMSKNWLTPDRDQLLLLPPSVQEWLPENHLARYVADVVERLDLTAITHKYAARHRGTQPYHPALMVALLFYGYSTGVMSSRKIERATHDSVAFRFLAGGHHPDHNTLASFRKDHLSELSALFLQILLLARELGFQQVGTVAIDGTKVKANASKHAAVSYKRAKEIEGKLRTEIARLMEAAEGADNTPLAEGTDIPAEIARREKRLEKIVQAQRAIEERHGREALHEHRAALEENLRETEEAVKKKERPPDPPAPPSLVPADAMQHNFTDAESRIMPDKGGFSQAYNAQLSVDVETRLIVGHHVSQAANDKRELLPALGAIAEELGAPAAALADAGFFSAANLEKAAASHPRTDLLIAPGRMKHHASLEDRLGPPAEGPAPPGATPAEAMRHKLKTQAGHALYALRKSTVEPVIGIVKEALGFRRFLLRGAEKVRGESGLVCLGYNLQRMWWLGTPARAEKRPSKTHL